MSPERNYNSAHKEVKLSKTEAAARVLSILMIAGVANITGCRPERPVGELCTPEQAGVVTWEPRAYCDTQTEGAVGEPCEEILRAGCWHWVTSPCPEDWSKTCEWHMDVRNCDKDLNFCDLRLWKKVLPQEK